MVDTAVPGSVEERTATGSATRRPSFEAALAAIRKAWGRPRRSSDTTDAPVSLNAVDAAAQAAPVDPAAPPQTPAGVIPAVVEEKLSSLSAQESIVDTETKSGREVDLTLDIEAMEEHSAPAEQHGPVLLDPEEIDVVARQVDEDVYELSASPELHDLEADLAAAAPPPPVPLDSIPRKPR